MRANRRVRRPRGRKSGTGGYLTPIFVSSRVWIGILVVGVALLALLLYTAPTVPAVALGGVALAIVLSFPVRALSHFMPRVATKMSSGLDAAIPGPVRVSLSGAG